MREAVFEKLDELNDRLFKNGTGIRHSAFENEEKAYIMPLPACDFEPAVWSVAKVANDYLILVLFCWLRIKTMFQTVMVNAILRSVSENTIRRRRCPSGSGGASISMRQCIGM